MRLAVIGLGLIGGSALLAAAARRGTKPNPQGIDFSEIIGIDANPTACSKAAHYCSAVYPNLSELPRVAIPDVVLIATPVQQFAAIAAQCQRLLPTTTTITDVGSTKVCFFDAFARAYGTPPPNLVGGHPIAGSEKSGFDAADAELFVDKLTAIVPSKYSSTEHITRVRSLWHMFGSRLVELDSHTHDQLLAFTSHLPHLLSFALVHYLGKQRDNDDMFRFASGGFRDFTRIAASDPTMWRDVTMSNQTPIVAALDGIIGELTALKNFIEKQDFAAVYDLFSRARAVRDYYSRSHQPYQLSGEPMHLVSHPCQSLEGVINIPGDKSISHRAVMLSALADGPSQISNLLEGEDNLATVQAFRDMGVVIEGPNEGQVRIEGVGLRGLQEPVHPLYMGNSGTAMRLMCGLLAGQNFTSRLTGDASLTQRPMKRVIEPLQQMGAQISALQNNYAPVRIDKSDGLQGICYRLPVASAQVKSCILLAGLYAQGNTQVIEPTATRDHTERMFITRGVALTHQGENISLTPPNNLKAGNWVVPGDISSAAFFLVAASIIPNSDILLPAVGINPTRIGILTILKQMGADITLLREEQRGQEPVADIRVRSSRLKGIHIDADLIALAIDEFPILCIAAACAEGETLVTGAEELRVKESDRIEAMVQGLKTLGIEVTSLPDGARILGGAMTGGIVDSFQDHRIAMAFAVAGSVASSPVHIRGCENIATSFPSFANSANTLGMCIENA